MSVRNSQAERTVTLNEVPHKEAVTAIKTAPDVAVDVAQGVPKFKEYACYSFKAEHAIIDGDIVIHFFLPAHARVDTPEAEQEWMQYWLGRFADAMDRTAREYFEAEHPRLVAKYTEEMASWWFRARGFGADILDPDLFVTKFYEKLDAALRADDS